MKFRFSICVTVTLLVLGASSGTAAVINLDAILNASLDGINAQHLLLGPGSYNVDPIIGRYTAFDRFEGVDSCDANGRNCRTGFEHSYVVKIDGVATGYGDGNALGGIGPISPGEGYYDTPEKAFALGRKSARFTLNAPTDVAFYIIDDGTYNNSGGISLDVAAVPEPAAWALMIAGFAAVGAALRRRADRSTIAHRFSA